MGHLTLGNLPIFSRTLISSTVDLSDNITKGEDSLIAEETGKVRKCGSKDISEKRGKSDTNLK
jgi:hypothetical protein